MLTNTGYRKLDAGNGSTVTFTFPFPFIASTDLKVYKVTKATGALNTLLVLNVDYTVTKNTVTEGGSITYTVAPTALQQSLIYRDVPSTQPEQFPAETNFPEERIETMGDRLAMLINQLKGTLERALLLPISSTLTNVSLPVPEAGKPIVGNATEDGFENSEVDIESLAGAQAAAEAAALAAAGSASAAGSAEDAAQAAQAAAEAAAATLTFASQAEAQAGTIDDKLMSPLRTAEAIAAQVVPGVAKDGTVGLVNLLQNGGFELWGAGASAMPDNWLYNNNGGSSATIAREASVKKSGAYGLKVTGGSNGIIVYQDISGGYGAAYWQGRKITLGVWIKTATGVTLGIAEDLGVPGVSGPAEASYATVPADNAWHFVTVTRTLTGAAANVYFYFYGAVGAAVYLDAAIMVEGESVFAFTPHPNDVHKYKVGTFQRDVATGSGSVAYTGVGFTPKAVLFFSVINGTDKFSFGSSDGTTQENVALVPTPVFFQNANKVILLGADGSNYSTAVVSSFDADGFTLAWTKTNSPTGTGDINYIAIG